MKLIRKILLATDLSTAAEDAAREAVVVATAFDAQIIPLYVVPPVPDSFDLAEVKRETMQRLAQLRERLQAQGASVAEPILASGDVAEEIVRQSDLLDVNGTMLASGDKPADEVYRLGITAERVMRQSSKAVWVVRPDSDPRIRRIVCPVDLSEPSRRALRNAIHLARHFKAELIVLHVAQPLASYLGGLFTVAEEAQRTHLAAQEKHFDKFLESFDFHDMQMRRQFRQGDPAKKILGAVREAEADLLVMGSVGKGSLARMVWGSVTEKVAREMACSIITVKGEHAIRLELKDKIDDLQTHMEQGHALLEKGFSEEALEQFEMCLARDVMYAPAWEGAAAVHRRLGDTQEAERCDRQAKAIIQSLWDKLVTADIRSRYPIPTRPKS